MLVVLGLLLADNLLFRSRYDPNLQTTLSNNIKSIIARIHEARTHAHNPDTDAETEA